MLHEMFNLRHASGRLAVLLICLLFTACIEDHPPGEDPFLTTGEGPETVDPVLRYNEIYRKACHNCYEKQYAESLGEALNFTPSIEIDFWESKDGFGGRRNGRWYVRHDLFTIIESGNDNCCTAGPNGTNDLDACLRDAAAWSDAHPGHAVITIFIDKKDGWSGPASGRDPEGLDSLLIEIFGDKLYTPADLQAGYGSPREAAADGSWPTMGHLRDRVIVALTGSNEFLRYYLQHSGINGKIFTVPKIGSAAQVEQPPAISSDLLPLVVFYNMNYATGDTEAASAVRAAGGVGRTWGMPENDAVYQQLIGDEVHIMALYDFREESFNGGQMQGPF